MTNELISNKYIATIDRYTLRTDFSKFSENNIAGLLIEAGSLFNSIHIKNKDFKNPQLYSQIESADKADLPYGFYFKARSRNKYEVKEEVYELSFILRKYPPKLGLWLTLDLTNSVITNDKILDEYYNRLVGLGLKNQLGLYVTLDELKTITWSNHQDEWWLWLINRYNSEDELTQDITPDIFDVEVN